jgi:hypothetical protein
VVFNVGALPALIRAISSLPLHIELLFLFPHYVYYTLVILFFFLFNFFSSFLLFSLC